MEGNAYAYSRGQVGKHQVGKHQATNAARCPAGRQTQPRMPYTAGWLGTQIRIGRHTV